MITLSASTLNRPPVQTTPGSGAVSPAIHVLSPETVTPPENMPPASKTTTDGVSLLQAASSSPASADVTTSTLRSSPASSSQDVSVWVWSQLKLLPVAVPPPLLPPVAPAVTHCPFRRILGVPWFQLPPCLNFIGTPTCLSTALVGSRSRTPPRGHAAACRSRRRPSRPGSSPSALWAPRASRRSNTSYRPVRPRSQWVCLSS